MVDALFIDLGTVTRCLTNVPGITWLHAKLTIFIWLHVMKHCRKTSKLTHPSGDACVFSVVLVNTQSLPQPQTGAVQAQLSELTLQQ